jgi:hypothetical protein
MNEVIAVACGAALGWVGQWFRGTSLRDEDASMAITKLAIGVEHINQQLGLIREDMRADRHENRQALDRICGQMSDLDRRVSHLEGQQGV